MFSRRLEGSKGDLAAPQCCVCGPDAREAHQRDETWITNVSGVFTAGDVQRGQSLIV